MAFNEEVTGLLPVLALVTDILYKCGCNVGSSIITHIYIVLGFLIIIFYKGPQKPLTLNTKAHSEGLPKMFPWPCGPFRGTAQVGTVFLTVIDGFWILQSFWK